MIINVTLEVQINAIPFSVHVSVCVDCLRGKNLRFY
jgi:hypothetical protein